MQNLCSKFVEKRENYCKCFCLQRAKQASLSYKGMKAGLTAGGLVNLLKQYRMMANHVKKGVVAWAQKETHSHTCTKAGLMGNKHLQHIKAL